MVICLERGADLRIPLPLTVSCFSKIQIGFTFLVPAYLGSPGQRAVKRVLLLWLYGCSEVNQLKGVGKSTSSLSHGASPLLKTRLSSSHPDLSSLQLLQPPDHRPGDFPEHCLKVFRADHACRYLLIHKVCPHPATRHSPVSLPPFSAFTNCLFMPL